MTNKKIKTAIIGNIALLAFSVILLVTMSFAWFTLSVESKAGQTINIGTFVVNLNDTGTGTVTQPFVSSSIAITAGYPMTRTEALKAENITANKNKYTFQIENKGSIAAMLKLTTTRTDTPANNGAARPTEFIPIAEQMRYTIRMYKDVATPGEYIEVKHDTTSTTKATSFLYDGTGSNTANVAATNTSLDEYLRGMLLAKVGETNNYTAKSDAETLKPSASFYFDIVIWLDETATVKSTNSNHTVAGFSEGFTFNLTMEAMQAQGGAFFTIT